MSGNGRAYLEKFGLTDDSVMALSPVLQGFSVAADDVVDIAKGLLENWSLTSLELTRCNVSGPGAFAIAEALGGNHTLRYVGLSHNNIGDSGCEELAEALARNLTLEIMDLSHCGIGDLGTLALAQMIELQAEEEPGTKAGEIRSINLEGNRIGKPGAAALAASLTQSTKIKSLNLHGNRLRESGALSLAEGIRGTNSLTYLNLGSNDINPEGGLAIVDALSMNNSISAINLQKNRLGPSLIGLADLCNQNTILREVNISNCCINATVAEQFAKQLTSAGILSLNLSDNQLENEGVAAICKALRGKPIRYLDLGNVGLTSKGMTSICELINVAPSLQTIILDGNTLSPGAMAELGDVLKLNTTIDSINLGETGIGNGGVSHLAKALTNRHKIRVLDLSGNNISNEGCIEICSVLAKMRRLSELDLTNNVICDEGGNTCGPTLTALCSVFSNNSDLRQISLSGCPISEPFIGGLLTRDTAEEITANIGGLPVVEPFSTGCKVVVDPAKDALRKEHRTGGAVKTASQSLFRPAWTPTVPPPKTYGDEEQPDTDDEDENQIEDASNAPLIPGKGSLLHSLYPGYGRGRMCNESHCDSLGNICCLPMYQSGMVSHHEETSIESSVSQMFQKPVRRARRRDPYSLGSIENNIGGFPITEDALRRKFQELDVDGSGYLDYSEFKVIFSNFQNFGLYQSQNEIESVLKKYKVLDDGKIHFDEFALIMLSLVRR
eukprot:TRINITY_DN18808_c0_g1_i1.p1 TRINITY_DN18808_c0_g1~~TRINITY_DN18808_c0_g1_i1.p1  ORF type:complete len:753 (+),score=113.39 TRINITY_DN18808_c0_g1_i1:82-2259(+)